MKIGSIGPEIATVLVGEVFFRQFNNRQEVGSYVGLIWHRRLSPATWRTEALSFLATLPFAREPLRFRDLCRGHFRGEGIPIFCRVFDPPASR